MSKQNKSIFYTKAINCNGINGIYINLKVLHFFFRSAKNKNKMLHVLSYQLITERPVSIWDRRQVDTEAVHQ